MNIHLYIGSEEVEFSTPPEILYTYQKDDLTNPTIVKNGFSKTIDIEGTPTNNKIFGHFWNVQRVQNTSGEGNGIYFNASRKVPFTLYYGSEIYEEGYVKLDMVNMEGHNIRYSISLYGGLGSFFYNLSINENGDERKLSDLDFDYDLSFTANIDTVKEAWEALKNGDEGKWQTLNFMTAYNGFPEDFDADKIIINTNGTTLVKAKKDGDKIYSTKDGFVLGELPDEMTEWEVRDLRSYLQRPVIRMRKIVEACCKPENNGGYDVVLDEDFFNEENPYWTDTWLTLPMIQNLEYSNEEQILEGATLITEETGGDNNSYMYQPLMFTLGEFSQSIPSSINVRGKIKLPTSNKNPYTSFVWYWNKKGDSYHSGFACYGSLFVQLIAKNGDTVVGASEAYNLTSPNRHDGELRFGNNSRYESNHKYNPYMGMPIYDILGWNKNGYWCYENETTPITLSFTIRNLQSNITDLELVYFWGSSKDKRKKDGVNGFYETAWDSGWATYSRSWAGVNKESLELEILSSNVSAVMGASLGRTGTKVDKGLLLNTEATPADYLLSYTKMFGLYYTKDVESNTIYIETRKSFYDRNEVIDLTDMIDNGKERTITPLTFDTKWYQFSQEADESAFYENYLQTRGVEYGSKVLNTGYEFIADKKQLLEDSAIKSGIEGLERSKYFSAYNNDNVMRTYFGLGLKYNLYNGDDTIEMIGSTPNSGTLLPLNEGEGMKYYDLFPKLQFHDGKNDATDGNNCLVFFSGFKNVVEGRATPLSYYLSDDTLYQTALNEGTPCWLFTTTEKVGDYRLAYKMTELPVFERYLTSNSSTKVKKSLDFGSPQELYIPDYSLTEDANIYYNFWKTYLEDLYDINTRKLTCYVKIKGRPNPNWLRRFYWFDGAIWRLNKIEDWNISGNDTTKMEFIKVQEIGNYTSITQTPIAGISIYTPNNFVVYDGGQINITIKSSEGWRIITTSEGISFSQTKGSGDATITATITQNNSSTIRPFYVTAINDNGQTSKIYLSQDYQGSTFVDVAPDNMIVSAGDYEVDFVWFNQGNNYINSYYTNGDADISADVEGEEYDNKATITVGENNTESVLSSTITFRSGEYEDSIGIDVLPKELEFSIGGESITLAFNYSTPIFGNVPYWISVEDNGDKTYTFTALPNYYSTKHKATITVTAQNSAFSGSFTVKQGVGVPITPNKVSVTPNNLYFESTGGTQFVNVKIPNDWVSIVNGNWISTSTSSSSNEAIVGITVAENTGSERTGIITYIDRNTGTNYSVIVTQLGTSTTRTFTVTPSAIRASSSGGTYTATINYVGKGNDYVNVVADSNISVSQISWVGEIGEMSILIPENYSVMAKQYNITFTYIDGEVILPITQAGAYPTGDGGNTNIDVSGDDTDGTDVSFRTNVAWTATTSDTWISVSPTYGEEGTNTISIDCEPNPNLESRTGYVYINDADTGTNLITYTITQGGLVETLTITPSSITFNSDGGTATITIKSNTNWTIENGTN